MLLVDYRKMSYIRQLQYYLIWHEFRLKAKAEDYCRMPVRKLDTNIKAVPLHAMEALGGEEV
jgi:hypothetical protein